MQNNTHVQLFLISTTLRSIFPHMQRILVKYGSRSCFHKPSRLSCAIQKSHIPSGNLSGRSPRSFGKLSESYADSDTEYVSRRYLWKKYPHIPSLLSTGFFSFFIISSSIYTNAINLYWAFIDSVRMIRSRRGIGSGKGWRNIRIFTTRAKACQVKLIKTAHLRSFLCLLLFSLLFLLRLW